MRWLWPLLVAIMMTVPMVATASETRPVTGRCYVAVGMYSNGILAGDADWCYEAVRLMALPPDTPPDLRWWTTGPWLCLRSSFLTFDERWDYSGDALFVSHGADWGLCFKNLTRDAGWNNPIRER